MKKSIHKEKKGLYRSGNFALADKVTSCIKSVFTNVYPSLSCVNSDLNFNFNSHMPLLSAERQSDSP